jgi:hypothetical protein
VTAPHLSRRALLGASVGALAADLARADLAQADDGLEDLRDGEPVALPAGRSLVELVAPAASFVTLAIRGPRHALLGARVLGESRLARALDRGTALDEDGLLPRIFSGLTREEEERISLLVDVTDPVTVTLVSAPTADDAPPRPHGPKEAPPPARPLVGMPPPESARAGYVVLGPARYAFARIDVVKSLRLAFEKTRKRFGNDPVAVSDMSQWNGRRPKQDLGEVRHISHDGGCDVDLALPASDFLPSDVRDHCKRVFLDPTHAGCAPGTAKGVRFDVLAHLLGALVDEADGRVVKIFVDDVYRREIVREAKLLHEKAWIADGARGALSEEGVLVASPWHTDHVHVRFAGERARSLLP